MAKPSPSIVARRIEEVRVARGMSRQELADKVELPNKDQLSYLQIYRIEKGLVGIDATLVEAIAAALECAPGTLYREAKAS